MNKILKPIVSICLAALLVLQLGGMGAAATEPIATEGTEPVTTEATEPESTEATEPVTTEASEPESTEATEPESTEATEPEEPPEPADQAHGAYVAGYNDGSFRPKATVTRAELAVIVYSLGDYAPGEARFPDVRKHAWFAQAVNALAAAGVVSGFPDGTFRPSAPVSRAELAVILAALSGKEPAGTDCFPDVPKKHWARAAITLAREEGWVTGYPDGTFRPNASLTRAEAVVMLNSFLGRTPDQEAIAAGQGLRYFPDVQPQDWFYNAVTEAATGHTAHYEADDDREHWLDPDPGALAPIPDGFYCFGRNLFAVVDGAYLREAGSFTLEGVSCTCKGSSGICRAQTEVLTLANGKLILLTMGRPLAQPGNYADGFYLKGGLLYLAREGSLVQTAGAGSWGGTTYRCAGASGVCTVSDWTGLALEGISLAVFETALTPEAQAQGTEAVTAAALLRAAVGVYETYFRVEYPAGDAPDREILARALTYGLVEEAPSDLDQPICRGDALVCLWRALRGRELAEVNQVNSLPDLEETDRRWAAVAALYRAGVTAGADEDHNVRAEEPITVSELAGLLTRLERPGTRLRFTLVVWVAKSIQYGVSGSGRYPLTAWQLGDGQNVMVLTFAVHGWEDNWNRDGEALVYLADQLKTWLEDHYDLLTQGNWRVYILRCVNPDGLYLGTGCNGPGRCTTTWYNAGGQLTGGRGIDINRSFPYRFRQFTESRNFNGYGPLACVEARALASFVQSVKGRGWNLCIDTHGWYGQIITSSGKGAIYRALMNQFPNSSWASLSGTYGFFSAWAAYEEGYDGCLFELPRGITGMSAFRSANCVGRFEAAIQTLLTTYRGAE